MTFTEFVTTRLAEMAARTEMWGSNEAVEMQALQLLEIEVFMLDPATWEKNPRRVFDAYTSALHQECGSTHLPLFMRIEDPKKFGPELLRLCSIVRNRIAR